MQQVINIKHKNFIRKCINTLAVLMFGLYKKNIKLSKSILHSKFLFVEELLSTPEQTSHKFPYNFPQYLRHLLFF